MHYDALCAENDPNHAWLDTYEPVGRRFESCVARQQKRRYRLLCILSGENTNTTKDFSLVVFFCWQRFYERLPPGGSWRRKATEGERVIMRSI